MTHSMALNPTFQSEDGKRRSEPALSEVEGLTSDRTVTLNLLDLDENVNSILQVREFALTLAGCSLIKF
jgi:hypothetical protein